MPALYPNWLSPLLVIGAGAIWLCSIDVASAEEAKKLFDPLSVDNEGDDTLHPAELTGMDEFGGYYTMTPPTEKKERIAFFIKNIANTTRGHSSPLGLDLSPISIALLFEGPDALPAVRAGFERAAANSSTDEEAELLACVLGRFHDKRSFELLAIAALSHPSDDVRRAACWALPRLDSKRSVPILVELLYPHPSGTDASISRLAAGAALAEATGESFPNPVYHDPTKPPVVIWEDTELWKQWSKDQDLDTSSLSEKIKKALLERQAARESQP